MFFIDEERIHEILHASEPGPEELERILQKAGQAHGLDLVETAALLRTNRPDFLERLYATAREVKETIYGRRLVLFAPLYLSNRCINNCLYCGFRRDNKELVRRSLTVDEAVEEARILVRQGHKRILMVCGEMLEISSAKQVGEMMRKIYAVQEGNGQIRRINVNMAPLPVEDFHHLKDAGLGTFQVFQETYHFETYRQMHPTGPKSDYEWRLFAMDRAFQGGIEDVGIGALFGLYDPRFEVLAMLQHIRHLEEKYGVGPHTISVPRLEPALNAPAANTPPYSVVDSEFKKIVAVLRLAVPYTGIILSTRESAGFRRELLQLGVSQISAGSRTFPGAYRAAESDKPSEEQFHIGDNRTLDQVIQEMAKDGFLPSFCTGCYRSGRTGEHFMELAKPGSIHEFCQPNAVLTSCEYLLDYASEETARTVWPLVEKFAAELPEGFREKVREGIAQIRAGKRDLYY